MAPLRDSSPEWPQDQLRLWRPCVHVDQVTGGRHARKRGYQRKKSERVGRRTSVRFGRKSNRGWRRTTRTPQQGAVTESSYGPSLLPLLLLPPLYPSLRRCLLVYVTIQDAGEKKIMLALPCQIHSRSEWEFEGRRLRHRLGPAVPWSNERLTRFSTGF